MSAADLVDRVRAETGYTLLVSSVPELEFDSELRIARQGQPYHSLAYQAAYASHRDHFIINACTKILRFWSDEQRLVPIGTTEELEAAQECEFEEKLEPSMQSLARPVSRYLAQALVRQLTSFPLDLRVEQAIRRSYPEHRVHQATYLRRQVREFLPTLSEAHLRYAPDVTWKASTALNIAFATIAADLINDTPPRAMRGHQSYPAATRLAAAFYQLDDTAAGDRALTDTWARHLGLERTYRWDHLPPP